MAMPELIRRLEQETDARVAAIVAAAEKTACAVANKSALTRQAERDADLATLRAQRKEKLDRELALVRRRAQTEVLQAQHRFLDRVHAQAHAMAEEFAQSPEYADQLPRFVDEAMRYLEDAPASVTCLPALQPVLKPVIQGRP